MNDKRHFSATPRAVVWQAMAIGFVANGALTCVATPDDVVFRSPATQMPLVRVLEGTFRIGSPENQPERATNKSPLHDVTITRVYLGVYEVTQAEFVQVMGSNPSEVSRDGLKPVTKVTACQREWWWS